MYNLGKSYRRTLDLWLYQIYFLKKAFMVFLVPTLFFQTLLLFHEEVGEDLDVLGEFSEIP